MPGWMERAAAKWRGLLWVGMLGVALVGCDDNVSQQQVVADLGEPDFYVEPDARPEGDTNPKPDATVIEEEACCILIPVGGSTSAEVNIGGRASLGVVLYSRASGNAIPNEVITWSMLTQGDSTLSALETLTNEQGVGRLEFIAGTELKPFMVRAEYPDTRAVEFQVTVMKLPSGNLKVNIINADARVMELNPMEVYLYPTDVMSCRHFNPLSVSPGELRHVTATRSGEQVLFEQVLSSDIYAVVGVGVGPNGNVVAKACVEGIAVREEVTEEVDLIFQLVPLNPVGTYRVRAYFNFGDAIAATGQVGQWLVRIFDGFNDPGRLLYDTIFSLCEQIAPAFLCDTIDAIAGITGIKQQIVDAITNAILGTNIGCQIVHAGCDVRDTVRNLELFSTLYMSKLGSNFGVFGSTTFTGLALQFGDQRIEIADDLLQNELQLLSGDWEASVVGYNRLIIGSHVMDLRYGQLIVYIINNVVLPALTSGQANNFNDALAYWFNCPGIAQTLGNVCVLGQCVGVATAENICRGALSLLGGVLGFGNALLSLQNVPSALQLSGEVTMTETTGDFQVDLLENGSWGGTLNINGTSSPINASWSGCNVASQGIDCPYPLVDVVFGAEGACSCNDDCSNCQR
jgi:hypothetical protein